uniref:PLOD1-3-like GT domain-containing protein n=1 Tax=viral metagenome TaxID=1070528 RepID=A0A6C0BPK8_9ZZZZ
MVQIFFCSFGTDAQQCEELKVSAERCNIPLTWYGLGQPWLGYHQKLRAMHRFVLDVESQEGPENIVCFLDGYDVLLADSAENIARKFLSFNRPLVISAEKFMKPDESPAIQRLYGNQSPSIYQYVNSGTYVGTVTAVKYMLQWCRKYKYNVPRADGILMRSPNDQRALTTFYLKHRHLCALDHEQQIFACLAGHNPLTSLRYQPLPLHHNITGSQPSIIHLNGRSKRYKKQVLQELINVDSPVNTLT